MTCLVVKYIKSTDLPTTYLYTCIPFSEVLHHLSKRGDDDFLVTLPVTDGTALPGWPVEQTGEWVRVAMAHPDKWIGESSQNPIILSFSHSNLLVWLTGKLTTFSLL